MNDRTHDLLYRNLQEVFGEATRRVVVRPSRNSIPRTVSP